MIKPDRIETVPRRRFIGLNGTFTMETRHEIPALWDRWGYTTVTGVLRPDQVFGISHNFVPPDQFDYMPSLEVGAESEVPEGMTELFMPAGQYAVFVHDGHVSGVSTVFEAVLTGQAPLEGHRYRPGPQMEVYGEGFDPATVSGRMEVWFPAEPE